MQKVSIKRNNEITHQGQFETLEEANVWIAEGVLNNWWGEVGEYVVVGPENITSIIEQEKVNAESLAYLKETDYLIIRCMENGKEVPQDILDKRQACRDAIVRNQI